MDATLRLAVIETLATVLKANLQPDMIMPVTRSVDDFYRKSANGCVRLWQIPGVVGNIAEVNEARCPVWLSEAGDIVSMSMYAASGIPQLLFGAPQRDINFWVLTVSNEQKNNEALLTGLRHLRDKVA